MAKLKGNVLGGISGTIGNIVGSSWRGINYIKSKPASVKNPNTEAQRRQRMRFRLVITLLRKIRPFVNIGFRNGGQKRTAMNYAMSVNIREAITGTYPDLEIDPASLVVSVGDLHGAGSAGLDLSIMETAIFTWANEAGVGTASGEDAAMVLLYNTDKDAVIYKLHGASREDETLEVSVPSTWSGDAIAGYLAFRSETGNEVSGGQYLGTETAA